MSLTHLFNLTWVKDNTFNNKSNQISWRIFGQKSVLSFYCDFFLLHFNLSCPKIGERKWHDDYKKGRKKVSQQRKKERRNVRTFQELTEMKMPIWKIKGKIVSTAFIWVPVIITVKKIGLKERKKRGRNF